jgi:two-component system chemotaxis response regulator CheY
MSKVVIIDDSDTIRSQLKKDLEAAGFSAVEAVDGLDGFNIVKANGDAKLIVCDVNMPKMDGVTLIQKLKSDLSNAIPIVMLTTESNDEMRAKGKENGVVAWVVKPYKADKLIPAIKKIIEMKKAG